MTDLNELNEIMEKNNEERLEFIDFWTNFMKNNSNQVWSSEQNRLINSLIK